MKKQDTEIAEQLDQKRKPMGMNVLVNVCRPTGNYTASVHIMWDWTAHSVDLMLQCVIFSHCGHQTRQL